MNAELVDAPSNGSVRGPIRVLVVEDDPVVRRLIRIRLSRAGLAVIPVNNGEEAIAAAETGDLPIHVVVTDGVMPGSDGFELARYFSRCHPNVRVILVSGYLSHFISRDDIPENIGGFFGKPFSGDELVAKVFELVRVVV